MAQSVITVTGEWTELATGVTEITFQNLGAGGMYIGFSTATGVAPAFNKGPYYDPKAGELKKALTDLTFLSGANTIWARSAGGQTEPVYVETA